MSCIKDRLAELCGSEYPKVSKTSGNRIRLTKEVVGSFKKRLKILSEAIEELNLDIKERESIGQEVQEKLDREIFHLEFVLKELENWKLVFCPGNKLTKFFYLVEYRISCSRPNKRLCI